MTATEEQRQRRWPWVAVSSFLLSWLYAIRVWCPDVWWHLATGRWMVENGQIPATDPFSFTAAGQPWIDVNWASDLVLYAAWAAGGAAGVVLLKVALAWGLLGALGTALRRLGVGAGAGIGTLVMVAFVLQPRYSMARPSTLGGVFLAVAVCLAVWTFTSTRRWGAWLFVPLLLCWQQFHPSSIVGLAILGAVAAGFVLVRRWPEAAHAGGALLVAAGAFVATPQGRQILGHFLTYQEDSLIVARTMEWAPLRLSMPLVWVPWALFAAAVAGGILARKRPLVLGMALVGAALGMRFTRHLYPGILLAAPALGILAQTGVDWLQRKGWALGAAALGPAAGVAVVVANLAIVPLPVFHNNFGFDADLAAYPHDTLPVLRTLPPGRAMNDYGIGGYLIWERVPGGVFFDGRSGQVFTEAHFRDLYRPVETSSAGLERVADQFEVVYGISKVKSHVGNQMMKSPEWVPVRHGQTSSLFVRRAEAHRVTDGGRALYPLLRWSAEAAWTRAHYDAVLADPETSRQLRAEFLHALREDPDALVVRRTHAHLASSHPSWLEALERDLRR